jgi:hypothetical protein
MSIITQKVPSLAVSFTKTDTTLEFNLVPATYVNASELCAVGAISFSGWLAKSSSRELLESLTEASEHRPVIFIGAGESSGFWVHPEIGKALGYSISKDIGEWVSCKIREIREGLTALPDKVTLDRLKALELLMDARERGHTDIVKFLEKELGLDRQKQCKVIELKINQA